MEKKRSKKLLYVADKKGTATLILWEADIDSLTLLQSYAFTKLSIRLFSDKHFLALTGGTITKIKPHRCF